MRKLSFSVFPFHDHSNLQLWDESKLCPWSDIWNSSAWSYTITATKREGWKLSGFKSKMVDFRSFPRWLSPAGQKSDVLCPNYTEITPSLRLIQATTCVSTSFFIFWSLRFSNLEHNDSADDIISQSKEVFFLEILKTIIKTPKENLQNLRSSSYDVMSSPGDSPSPQPRTRTPPRSPFDR